MLADYWCADEDGGSGVASCVGPVGDGAIVPNGLGAHTFTVTGTDGEGNVGTASTSYVVFDDISGPITNQSVFASGRVIPIILELGGRVQGSGLRERLPAGSPRGLRHRRSRRHRSAGQRLSEPVEQRPADAAVADRSPAGAAPADRSSSGSASTAGRAPTPCSPCASPELRTRPWLTPRVARAARRSTHVSSSRPNGRECPAQTSSTGSARSCASDATNAPSSSAYKGSSSAAVSPVNSTPDVRHPRARSIPRCAPGRAGPRRRDRRGRRRRLPRDRRVGSAPDVRQPATSKPSLGSAVITISGGSYPYQRISSSSPGRKSRTQERQAVGFDDPLGIRLVTPALVERVHPTHVVEVVVGRHRHDRPTLHERLQLASEIPDPVARVHDEVPVPAPHVPHVRLEERDRGGPRRAA